jgi:hypothetical protein
MGGSSCSWNSIQGSGVEATETRAIGDFRRVRVSGSADVIAHVGAAPALSLTGDDNLLQYVETEVRGETLHIGMAPGSYSFHRGLVVELSVPQLDGLAISGSSDTRLSGLSGPAFEVAISGSGDVYADGAVERLTATVSGSGEMDLGDLTAREAQVRISGSGDVLVNVAERLSVHVSGSGDVRYRGNPETSAQISGSGTVSGS